MSAKSRGATKVGKPAKTSGNANAAQLETLAPEASPDDIWTSLRHRIDSWSGTDEEAIRIYLSLDLDRVLRIAAMLDSSSRRGDVKEAAVNRALEMIGEADAGIQRYRREILRSMNLDTLKRLAAYLGIGNLHEVASDYKLARAFDSDPVRLPIISEMCGLMDSALRFSLPKPGSRYPDLSENKKNA